MIPWRRERGPYLDDGVLFNCDRDALAFLRIHLPHVKDFGPSMAVALPRDGVLVGAVVFNNWCRERGDIEISAAFTTRLWARPRTFRRVFAIPFADIGCHRLTLNTASENSLAQHFAAGAGFELEGIRRRAWDGHQDLMTYGLLREECRYLRD